MKYALLLAFVLGTQFASAGTIKCPDIGEINRNGDELVLVYGAKLGFSDRNDIAYLVNEGAGFAEYRTSKWGALLTIPLSLFGNQPVTAEISVIEGDGQFSRATCTVE